MIKSLTRFALPFIFISPFHFVEAAEDEQASYADNFLFGGWGGSRARMADDGTEFEFILTSDFYNLDYYDSNTLQQETKNVSLYNADLTMTIDAEKKWGMKGATFFFYALGNWGDKPTEDYVGDVQTFDNIETADAWKLYEAWYQQSFASERLSLLFGLFDLNSEFDVIETAGLFSSSSHGIGPDFSQSGETGPSIFATTSLSLRLAYNITDETYLQGVVMDGIPGDPNNPRGTHIKLNSEDGLLTAFEFGHVSADDSPYHKFSLGYWGYTKAAPRDLENGNDIQNSGVYAAADGTVFQESDDPAQGLNIFVRYGFVNEDKINDVTTYTGVGMVYTGLFPGRDEDQFGIAIAIANPTDSFKNNPENLDVAEAETSLTFTYYAPITSWFSLKPDIQLISNPGMVNNKADAIVIGVRTEISF